jgi:hypothetical protein
MYKFDRQEVEALNDNGWPNPYDEVEEIETDLLAILNCSPVSIPLSEENFKQLLASAFSSLQVSTRSGL